MVEPVALHVKGALAVKFLLEVKIPFAAWNVEEVKPSLPQGTLRDSPDGLEVFSS